MKFYKIWRTYYESTLDTTAVYAACVVYETFYFNDLLQNWNRDCYSNG